MKIIAQNNDIDLGKRLDLFLALKLPQFSRSFIKKVIESNEVEVNSKVCFKAGYKVLGADVIDFPDKYFEAPPTIKKLPKSKFDLEIIEEDEDYIFINKPIGLVVHPTGPHQNDTLVNKLLDLYDSLPGDNILRPGIVHRLDKDTSGVIIIAKTPKALWWITGQFAERKVKKEYSSIGLNLDSNFRYKPGDEFDFEGIMRRSSDNQKRFVIEKKSFSTHQGRFSKSHFKIIDVVNVEHSKNVVLSKIYPATGRTHQIRVHQQELGFPIMKDPIYMSRKGDEYCTHFFSENDVADRLYLHASNVMFENYNEKLYSISAQIPKEFEELIKHAKKSEKRKIDYKF